MYDRYASQYNLPQQAGVGGLAPGNMGQWPVSRTNSGRGGQQQAGNANAPAGLLPAAGAYFKSPIPDYFPGQAIAGFTPNQQEAYDWMVRGAQQESTAAKQLRDFTKNRLAQGPQFNPYVGKVITDYQNLMNQQFAENQLPNLRGSAIQAGGLGGSRQALEEALASQRLNQTVGEQTGNLLKSGWDTAQQNYQSLMGLAPGIYGYTSAAELLPGQIRGAWGAAQQDLQQQRLNAEMARWNWYRDAAAGRLNQYQQNLSGAGSYNSATSSSTGQSVGPSQGGLFGGAGNTIGAALYGSPYLRSAFDQSGRAEPAPIMSGSSTLMSPATATGGAPIYSY